MFALTDNTAGNAVAAYQRAPSGALTAAGTYRTGGLGGQLSGSVVDHTASQGALAYDADRGLLIAVNPGSNTISVFRVHGDRLALSQVLPSGGDFPVSVTVHGDSAYVLNALGGGSLQGYRVIGSFLVPLPGSSRALNLGTTAASAFTATPGQVAFTPDGPRFWPDCLFAGPAGYPAHGTLPAMDADAALLRRLRDGDEQAFTALIERYNSSMLRLAVSFVPSLAVAEEVVQDTWLAMLRGLERFEERSSLRTWLFTILVNRARTTGVRESRSVPVADAGPAVDASRFGPSGGWTVPPAHWTEEAENRIDAVKLSELLRAGLDSLPARQREVVVLRDVESLTSAEVCDVLAISEANQRVLLHRGRSKLRQLLESELGGGEPR